MPGLDDMMDPEDRPPAAWAATVNRAPGSLSGKVTVTLDHDGSEEECGRRWMPRGDDLPAKGDPATVVFDDSGDAVLVAWHPA